MSWAFYQPAEAKSGFGGLRDGMRMGGLRKKYINICGDTAPAPRLYYGAASITGLDMSAPARPGGAGTDPSAADAS